MLFFTLRQLKSSNEATRMSAVERLRESKDPRAVEHLISALCDSSFLVRMTAADSLSDHADKRAVPALLNLLQDEAPGVRQSAVTALGRLGDDQIKKSLLASLTDEDSNVRQAASDILKKAQSPEIESALAKYRLEEEERKRAAEEMVSKRIAEKEQQKNEEILAQADQKMIQKLVELAGHYAKGGTDRDQPWLAREVQEIGRTLYARGGITEMERVWLKMPLIEGKREVELQWNSIGDWAIRWSIPTKDWNKRR